VKEVQAELKRRMHATIRDTGQWLKVSSYRTLPILRSAGNYEALDDFRYLVYWNWRRALKRRSQKGHITWKRMNEIIIAGYLVRKFVTEHPLTRIGV